MCGLLVSSYCCLSIPVNGTEMVYSVGFADTASETLTPTSGFNTRQTQTGTNATIVSFDELFTGGTADNVVTASTTPGSLHVIIIALSPTPVSSPILQIGWGVSEGIEDLAVTGAYPYPNTAGNLLILVSRVYERSDYTVADTQGNTWVVAIAEPSTADLVVAYCLSAKEGANTVTLTGNTGGDDVSFTMILAEYKICSVTASSVACAPDRDLAVAADDDRAALADGEDRRAVPGRQPTG